MHGHMNVELKKERLFTSFSRTLVYGASILWVGWHLTKIKRGKSAAARDVCLEKAMASTRNATSFTALLR